ncbi:MAG: diguanylate cyclase [Bacteroidales bacterium]|nr:diguanylate cyclase [Bacteroidales bacterium]
MSFSTFDIAFAAGILSASLVYISVLLLQRKRLSSDYLTGLPSFRDLLRYMKRQKKGKYIFILIDIDDFRRFNSESYENGDVVIRDFAYSLTENLSNMSDIFRYKLGDEFVLIAPVEKKAEIIQKLDSIHKKSIAEFTYSSVDYSAKQDSVEDIMHKAGGALILKKNG